MEFENHKSIGRATRAVHSGESTHKALDSITDPIVLASTYTFVDSQSIIDYIEQGQSREEYGRYGNPNEAVVERKLAALEGGEEAIVYSSGMAALVGLVMTKLDGTAKGGVLVALADKFGLPIHAIGVGEQIDDLAPFDPDEFAAALTGADVE
jgi:O-acetylhomoserine/O-acetylserine sulfhydrylase-like pyridoxal-dependent enzyme